MHRSVTLPKNNNYNYILFMLVFHLKQKYSKLYHLHFMYRLLIAHYFKFVVIYYEIIIYYVQYLYNIWGVVLFCVFRC